MCGRKSTFEEERKSPQPDENIHFTGSDCDSSIVNKSTSMLLPFSKLFYHDETSSDFCQLAFLDLAQTTMLRHCGRALGVGVFKPLYLAARLEQDEPGNLAKPDSF